jgi:hypothetical protein
MTASTGHVIAVGDPATFDAAYGTPGIQGRSYSFYLQSRRRARVSGTDCGGHGQLGWPSGHRR